MYYFDTETETTLCIAESDARAMIGGSQSAGITCRRPDRLTIDTTIENAEGFAAAFLPMAEAGWVTVSIQFGCASNGRRIVVERTFSNWQAGHAYQRANVIRFDDE